MAQHRELLARFQELTQANLIEIEKAKQICETEMNPIRSDQDESCDSTTLRNMMAKRRRH